VMELPLMAWTVPTMRGPDAACWAQTDGPENSSKLAATSSREFRGETLRLAGFIAFFYFILPAAQRSVNQNPHTSTRLRRIGRAKRSFRYRSRGHRKFERDSQFRAQARFSLLN